MEITSKPYLSILYRHPIYPWMVANLDRRISAIGQYGTTAILEIKTTTYNNKDAWEYGMFPLAYEYQVRHYMAVMNIDTAYICCSWDNNSSAFACYRIDRDYEIERIIIETEMNFWLNNVIPNVVPTLVGTAEQKVSTIGRYTKSVDEKEISLDAKDYLALAEAYLAQNQKRKDMEKLVDIEKEKEDQLKVAFIQALGNASTGRIVDVANKFNYDISYKASRRKDTINTQKLEEMLLAASPMAYQIYKDCLKDCTTAGTESRRFSLKKKEIKEKKGKKALT